MIYKFIDNNGSEISVNSLSSLQALVDSETVKENTEVLTQSLTFIATINAIKYCNADPVFIDVDLKTLGMCHVSLKKFLDQNCEIRNDGKCWNKLRAMAFETYVPESETSISGAGY